MGDVFYISQFHSFICEKSQCPFGISFWWCSTGKRNDSCLYITCNLCRNWRCLSLLPRQRSSKPFLTIACANRLDGSWRCVIYFCNFCNSHILFAIAVGCQQNIRPQYGSSRRCSFRNNIVQLCLICVRQLDDIFVRWHSIPSQIVLGIAYHTSIIYASFRCNKLIV